MREPAGAAQTRQSRFDDDHFRVQIHRSPESLNRVPPGTEFSGGNKQCPNVVLLVHLWQPEGICFGISPFLDV
jgi:hypothetical protein